MVARRSTPLVASRGRMRSIDPRTSDVAFTPSGGRKRVGAVSSLRCRTILRTNQHWPPKQKFLKEGGCAEGLLFCSPGVSHGKTAHCTGGRTAEPWPCQRELRAAEGAQPAQARTKHRTIPRRARRCAESRRITFHRPKTTTRSNTQ